MSIPNFTGNFRQGRRINLARGSASTLRNSHSVLQDASAARAKREENRKREKAAVAIQSFYRGRQEIAATRMQMREAFIANASSGEASEQIDPNESVAMFLFFFGKCGAIEDDVKLVPALEQVIRSHASQVRPLLARKLAKLMLSCVETAASSSLTEPLLRLLSSVQKSVDLSVLLEAYSSLLSHLSDAPTAAKVVDNVISALGSALDSAPDDRDRVLKLYVLLLLSTSRLFVTLADTEQAKRLAQIFDFDRDLIPALEACSLVTFESVKDIVEGPYDVDLRMAWLLANVLFLWKETSTPSSTRQPIHLMHGIGNLLLSLSASTVTRLAKRFAKEETSGKTTGIYDPFILSSVLSLEDRDVFEMAISPFRNSSSTISLEDCFTICRFLVGLARIWPGKTSKIRYFLYLNPEHTLPLFFKTLESLSIFIALDSTSQSSNADPRQTLWPTINSASEMYDKRIEEWEILALFLDICWHWMIMTDDDEFFDDKQYGLSQDDVRRLGLFLKTLVCLIICNSDPNTTLLKDRSLKLASGNDNYLPLYHTSNLTLDSIKQDAVGIMRQLYYRDARRHFLGDAYWLMLDALDVSTFSQLAVADAERAKKFQDADGDGTDGMVDSSSESEEDEDGDKRMANASAATRRDLKRRMTSLPRLELLQKVPFVLPFSLRVEVLDKSLEMDRHRTGLDRDYELRHRRYTASIRRGRVLEDAFEQLGHLKSELKSLIGITFYNEYGAEAGIDGGGITKEFLSAITLEGFGPESGLFVENSENMLYPNPQATSPEQLQRFEFLGRIIGKAIYQGILLEVAFAQFFLSKWQVQGNSQFGSGFRNTFDDLWSLDAALYQGLIKLKNFKGDVEAVFGLNFTITNASSQTVELIRNGANVPVTNSNRLQYIHAVADYKLNKELYLQTMAFLSGMNDLLSPSWLMMFGPHEMQTLIGGAALPIDLEDWRRNTVLSGYLQGDDTVRYFWEVISEFSDKEVREVLKFATSVPRAPLQGFGSLNPKFTIHEAGLQEGRLPTASTCVNMLKLPRYSDKKTLREKLLLSITAGAGFDLS
ncbi:hypothetical protein BZA70DRAFT_275641 [Myxozyma melibiosi]|uniref:HECT-type E3 ubiquitin transferase n=1 Tax=Myxozyma melibiosi TaxID=54550 RepID=A0ABR1F8A3_9ASCO